jgi:hypothetical protein
LEDKFSLDLLNEELFGKMKVTCFVFKTKVKDYDLKRTKEIIHERYFKNGMAVNDSLTTYDQLPLKFDHIEVRNDTVEILFRFVYRGIDINGTIVENPSAWGCVYKLNSTKIIKVVSSGTYRYNSLKCDKPEDCPDMFDAINMENVSQYLKSHKGDVNSWFRNEAIKRGLIKDKIEMK